MSDRRQKNQLELAFVAEGRGEAPLGVGLTTLAVGSIGYQGRGGMPNVFAEASVCAILLGVAGLVGGLGLLRSSDSIGYPVPLLSGVAFGIAGFVGGWLYVLGIFGFGFPFWLAYMTFWILGGGLLGAGLRVPQTETVS
jgi:hypothetical protein